MRERQVVHRDMTSSNLLLQSDRGLALTPLARAFVDDLGQLDRLSSMLMIWPLFIPR